jgi:hypothetical protein
VYYHGKASSWKTFEKTIKKIEKMKKKPLLSAKKVTKKLIPEKALAA